MQKTCSNVNFCAIIIKKNYKNYINTVYTIKSNLRNITYVRILKQTATLNCELQ